MVVGATTLKPGEDTTLALPLLMGMHQGMEGLHVFAVDIRSNDPVDPVKTLRWRFNVKEGQP
ncbi:MAG TPA: hypothetical protein VJM51_05170 [Dehalococcoidia bacterium]|nr:hypothetical protein [Dehalococcoidia bacterium]HLE80981.1 hypothetical protein [Dehalococcoidia bacterium]